MKHSRRIRSSFLPFMVAATALFIALHLPLCAQTPATGEVSVKPGINNEYLKPGLDISKWVARFEKPGREVFDQREKMPG